MIFRSVLTVVLFAAYITAMAPAQLHAQVASNQSWKTISTPNFYVHFPKELDSIAQLAAAKSEVAYSRLASELVRPRGKIDLVITDAVDGSNGYATVFPRNKIVIQIKPPVDQPTLQGYSDWLTLVLQHELAHIFHLDRTAGIWRFYQRIVGRNTITFPNVYLPSWIIEGIAVHYESRLIDGGRLGGAYIHDLVGSAQSNRSIPSLSDLSLARSKYPMGQSAYSYGALVIDGVSRYNTGFRGEADQVTGSLPNLTGLRKYIDRTAQFPIPYLLDENAERAFGISFSDWWDIWKDSVYRAKPAGVRNRTGWQIVGGTQRYTSHPRWWNDSSVVFLSDNGKDAIGLYRSTYGMKGKRLSTRNSMGVNTLRYDNAIVFSQHEYTDRFNLRDDLFITKSGHTRRLTEGLRYSAPDLRYNGEIAAVRADPGTTSVVHLSADAKLIRELVAGTQDTQWHSPRWTPAGDALTAVYTSGRNSGIVLFDTDTGKPTVIASLPGLIRSPVWLEDGQTLLFVSDAMQDYRVFSLNTGAVNSSQSAGSVSTLKVLTDESFVGVHDVDIRVVSSSPDELNIAAIFQDESGFRLGVRRVSAVSFFEASNWVSPGRLSDAVGTSNAVSPVEAESTASSDSLHQYPVKTYSPWRSLVPAYWNPLLEGNSDDGFLLGASTSATDPAERHNYLMRAYVNTRTRKVDFNLTYGYERFANPLFRLAAFQSWSHTPVVDSLTVVGELAQRSNVFALHSSFVRPRRLSNAALTVGAEMEVKSFAVTPDSLTGSLPSFYRNRHAYPTLLAAVQFNNALKPQLAPSAQNGLTFSATARQRWKYGTSGQASQSAVAILSGYKGLSLGGYGNHVVAFRIAGGLADANSPSDFVLGGVSGSALEVVPGFTIGDNNRTFPLRGYKPGVQRGVRAVSASVEYRVPLVQISKGVGLLPLFLDRTSISLFGDAGKAYCAGVGAPVCIPTAFSHEVLSSYGAEFNTDLALQYDTEYRMRVGLAMPSRSQRNGGKAGGKDAVFYLSFGSNF